MLRWLPRLAIQLWHYKKDLEAPSSDQSLPWQHGRRQIREVLTKLNITSEAPVLHCARAMLTAEQCRGLFFCQNGGKQNVSERNHRGVWADDARNALFPIWQRVWRDHAGMPVMPLPSPVLEVPDLRFWGMSVFQIYRIHAALPARKREGGISHGGLSRQQNTRLHGYG